MQELLMHMKIVNLLYVLLTPILEATLEIKTLFANAEQDRQIGPFHSIREL